MSTEEKTQAGLQDTTSPSGGEVSQEIPDAARRALAEAAERRALQEQASSNNSGPKEINGRDGPDPARYGDWEKKGIAVDF